MTMNEFQRAALAMFAAREAGPGASAEEMRAIAVCIRNRVQQGWHDGEWLKVMENAGEVRANQFDYGELDATDRDLQMLVRDIDEIYFARRDWDKDPSRMAMPPLDEAIGKATYWAFLNKPYTPWFRKNILENPRDHPPGAQMGTMMFYT